MKGNNIDLLIITSPEFRPIIYEKLAEYTCAKENIKYHLLDINSLFDAGCARLHIFTYDYIDLYDKILYLDVDIIIGGPIHPVFDQSNHENRDLIYVLEEGNIGDELWGGDLFSKDDLFRKGDLFRDINSGLYDKTEPAFTSGIIFFYNNSSIRQFFSDVLNHISEWVKQGNKIPVTLDQPFIIYNAFIQNKYNNQWMKTYAINNPPDITDIKPINHFPGEPGLYSSKYEKMMAFWKRANSTAFITLTNSGYIDYTRNCLKSLEQIKSELALKSYCIGQTGYDTLVKEGYPCELIDQENNSNFQTFRNGNWSNITYNKFQIIYDNLLKYDYVCFTDGDIVFENPGFYDYLIENIGDYDLLAQSEGEEFEDFCSGFMYIRSNPTTLSIFDPLACQIHKDTQGWDDQIYLNTIKKNLKYKKLPLDLFPNGKHYFQNNNRISPYLIHFNWLYGDEKKDRMKHYNKWYLTQKVRIFQGGSDGFGHQLEGTLRLISLSLNNKADYQYKYKKNYSFQHSNFDITKLISYLTNALNLLSETETETETENVISVKETIKFQDIIKNHPNYRENIYLYDGVGDSNDNSCNYETMKEYEKSIPLLRDAFVKNNPGLPPPSYDREYINVVCHIRLGDAVGQRVLDNESIFHVIRFYQKQPDKYKISLHSDGDIQHLAHENTILYDKFVDVLQVLSDFIHADVFIMNYSSISIAAHLLADDSQIVICPNNAGPTFHSRILDKCIQCNDFLLYDKVGNKTFSWENCKITFLENRQMIAFGGRSEYKYIADHVIWCYFGFREHILYFNDDYTAFTSVRKDDHYVVRGHILIE
jgi:hypothetical protein